MNAPSPSVATYRRVFVALMAMAALTTAVAFVDLGAFNPAAALLIAAAKTTLVILYFMHVRFSSAITKLFAGVAFAFLAVLIALTLSDVLTRPWLAPVGPPPAPGHAAPKSDRPP
jgi:cytochrome c oxidase subunit 4